jgi:F0F1-type ATP synthase membrane subunit b/b'
MKAGAELVGMVDGAERDQEIRDKDAKIDRLEREARQAQNYADRLEDAFEHRAQPIEVNHRKKPRDIRPKESVNG